MQYDRYFQIIIKQLFFSIIDFTCVYGLLPDRKKTTYQQLFKELKSVAALTNRLFKPERIISDFESGLMPAVAAEVSRDIHVLQSYVCSLF